MFRTLSLSIISFSLYTQQWYMSYSLINNKNKNKNKLASRIRTELQFRPDPARKLSANLCDVYHCCVYSEKLLMIYRGSVRNIRILFQK